MTEIGKSRIAVYNLLKEKPLFDYFENEQINVLILGTGWIGNEAFKCIFANGQYPHVTLNITVGSKNANEYCEKALEAMPELANFAQINGVEPSKDNYANIFFKEVDIPLITDQGISLEVLKTLVDNPEKLNYIIIALGDDENNGLLAHALADTLKDNIKLIINYYSNSEIALGENNFVNRFSLVDGFESSELFKLANNINYFYSSVKQDANYDDISQSFAEQYVAEFVNEDEGEYSPFAFIGKKKAYGVDSSIASALHIYTKLDYLKSKTGCEDVINELCQHIKNKDKLYYELVCLEHRRWNAFMIIRGYRYPNKQEIDDLECNRRDDEKRLHLCLCTCLDGPSTFKKDKKGWNNNPNLKSELDAASYLNYLKNKNKGEENRKEIEELLDKIKENSASASLFILSVNRLISNNDNAYLFYLSEYNKAKNIYSIRDLVEELNELLKPMVEANKKVDFLAIDEQIIDMIPFCFELLNGRRDVVIFVNGPIVSEAYLPLALLAKQVTFVQINEEFDVKNQNKYLKEFYENHHGNNVIVEVKPLNKEEGLIAAFKSLSKNKNTVLGLSKSLNLKDSVPLIVEFKNDYPIAIFDIDKNSVLDFSGQINVASYSNLKISIGDIILLLNGEYHDNDSVYKVLPPYEIFEKSGFVSYYLRNREKWNGYGCICEKMFDAKKRIPCFVKIDSLDLPELVSILAKMKIVKKLNEVGDKFEIIDMDTFNLFFTGEEYDPNIRNMVEVSKGGNALEIIVYYYTIWTGLFSDVQPDVDFRWGFEHGVYTRNELDVVALPLESTRPLLISVKSCQQITREFIYEIKSHSIIFDAIPILVARGKEATDPYIQQRAKASGVSIVYADDLVNGSKYKTILKNIIDSYKE